MNLGCCHTKQHQVVLGFFTLRHFIFKNGSCACWALPSGLYYVIDALGQQLLGRWCRRRRRSNVGRPRWVADETERSRPHRKCRLRVVPRASNLWRSDRAGIEKQLGSGAEAEGSRAAAGTGWLRWSSPRLPVCCCSSLPPLPVPFDPPRWVSLLTADAPTVEK